MTLSGRQCVEVFHLQFLRQLAAGAGRTHFTVKGGCNLRFFFGSIRYSEDLDLDVAVVARGTLKNKVDRLLASPALALPLRRHGIAVTALSAPKQTETTPRWKIGLSIAGQSIPLRTKVEFSRRVATTAAGATAVETFDGELARSYEIPLTIVQHYVAVSALVQKVEALAGRPQAQARDVFDLQQLRAHLRRLPELTTPVRRNLPIATERARSLTYDDYLGQVFAYLAPEHAAPFRGEAAWTAMQAEVVQLLQEL